MNDNWPPRTVALLVLLWGQGLSTGEIARRLGLTKNMVVGKADRMCLPKRGSPIKTVPVEARAEERAPLAEEGPRVREGCRFPMWRHEDRPTQQFCGAPKRAGSPYCPTHHAKCYVPATDRRLAAIDRAAERAAGRRAA